jgi:histidine triad (HIT) family protein
MGTDTGTSTEMKACLFCEIVQGKLPAHVVHEDAKTLTFLDKSPLFHGHCLVVPREHREAIWDLEPSLVEPVFATARLIARAVVEGLGAEGAFVAINNKVSQSVPHLHVHVVPRVKGDGLKGFFWPRRKYKDDAEMAAAREKVAATVKRLST